MFLIQEMGFTWAQSTNALKSHLSLEEAIEALFTGEGGPSYKGKYSMKRHFQTQKHYFVFLFIFLFIKKMVPVSWMSQNSGRKRTAMTRMVESGSSNSPLVPDQNNPEKQNRGRHEAKAKPNRKLKASYQKLNLLIKGNSHIYVLASVRLQA